VKAYSAHITANMSQVIWSNAVVTVNGIVNTPVHINTAPSLRLCRMC